MTQIPGDENSEDQKQTEKDQVREVMLANVQIEVGQTWYIVSQQWWRDWKAYARYDNLYARLTETPRPGPITNEDILDASGSLKKHLSEHAHIMFLPEKVWVLLEGWYTGVAIPRQVVKAAYRRFIEVYPWTLTLSYTEAGMLQQFTVTVSQTIQIKELREVAREKFNIPPEEDVVLWEVFGSKKDRRMEQDSQCLCDTIVFNGDKVIVELGSEANDTEMKTNYGNFDSDDEPDRSYSKSSTSVQPKKTTGIRGLVGLGNLGNTCFMNSSLQCLSNTVPLRNYFLGGEFYREINFGNALGTKGELVQAFSSLIKDMWNGATSQVAPRVFKHTLGKHAEQFMGYDQHDSQELIAYLLDGIHEDVNRVDVKPYVEQVEAKEDESDESAADRAWEGHQSRNASEIVDLFQGQFKSVVTCPMPECNRVSITFDPFMYLSVPLPFSEERTLTVTFVPCDGSVPKRFNVCVAKATSVKTAVKAAFAKMNGPSTDETQQTFNVGVADIYHDEVWDIIDLTKNLTDVQDNVEMHIYDLPPPSETVEPPQPPDMSWIAQFKKYLYSPQPFVLAMQNPATEIGSIENKFRAALDLSVYLTKAVDDFEVSSAARRNYTFDRIKTTDDRDEFLESLEGFKTWFKWFQSDFGSEFLPVLVRSETVRQVRDNYSIMYPTYRTQRVMDPVGLPLLVRYTNGVSTLGSVLDDVARQLYRSLHDKDESTGEAPEISVEARIQRAREILEQSTAIIELKKKYGTPDRVYLKRTGEEQTEAESQEADVMTTPLSEWLTRGCRLLLMFDENLSKTFVDIDQAKRLEQDDVDNLSDKKRKNQATSLYECIDCFMRKEQLEETEMWYCSQCKEHRQAWKQFYLWKTPPVLVIHLKRFQYDGMWRDKLDKLVTFPIEGLDLSPYVLDGRVTTEPIYDLYAVSNHYGGMGGGHYTAYCKNSQDGEWYEFDDSSVHRVVAGSIITEAAYVLFYMRRDLFPERIRAHTTAPSVAMDVQDAPGDSKEDTKDEWVHVEDTKPVSDDEVPGGSAQEGTSEPSIDDLIERGQAKYVEFKETRGHEIPAPVTKTTTQAMYKKRNMYNTLNDSDDEYYSSRGGGSSYYV